MTYIPAIPSFAAPAPDKFTLPGDIPDFVKTHPAATGALDADASLAPLPLAGGTGGGPEPGVPSQDWRARGLASPAGRGWEPVLRQAQDERGEGSRQRGVPLHHPADGPPPPEGEDRGRTALSPYLDDLPETAEDTWPAIKFDRARQRAFLLELSECGQVRVASARAGISYRTAYRERRTNAAFRRAWEAALLSALAFAEDALTCRALDGVEEAVFFRGEEVGRRVRFDSRLLLAHLARLDRRAEDAATRAFAADLEGALDRYLAGCDDPAPVCADCGEALPMAASTEDGGGAGEGDAAPAPFSPGPCDRCDMPSAKAAAERAARAEEAAALVPCPDCGGACLGDEAQLTGSDCMWLGNRLERMELARPAGALRPHDFSDHPADDVEWEQLCAFESGVGRWWMVVPPPADLPLEEMEDWYFHDA